MTFLHPDIMLVYIIGSGQKFSPQSMNKHQTSRGGEKLHSNLQLIFYMASDHTPSILCCSTGLITACLTLTTKCQQKYLSSTSGESIAHPPDLFCQGNALSIHFFAYSADIIRIGLMANYSYKMRY